MPCKKLKQCETILHKTKEWQKFVQATAWMVKQRRKVLRPDWDSKWKEAVRRYEENVLNPLEEKWQKILKNEAI